MLQYEKGMMKEEIAQMKKQKAETDDKHFAASVHEKNADKDSTQKETELSILKKKIETMRR